MREYEDFIEDLRASEPALTAELASFTGISSVLDWMSRRGLNRTSVDIVGQDEFHYDFLVHLGPGSRWIAFGVT